MGSEARATTVFHVTGFKRFHGVAHNPTETLISLLPTYMTHVAKMPRGSVLGSCSILETAAEGGLANLLDLLSKAMHEEPSKSEDKEPLSSSRQDSSGRLSQPDVPVQNSADVAAGCLEQTVWIHLGVNSGASKIAIEKKAFNEATFRCPDEMGWQPQNIPIVAADGPLTFARQTKLPANWIVESLRLQGLDVVLSEDAGRFVCNYVYYQSLRFAEEVSGAACIFVHVPMFLVQDEQSQLRFLAALLGVLANC
eukprot:SM000281S10744  [mRNA]  locus=s281:58039:60161:+ [translate_table: standard]